MCGPGNSRDALTVLHPLLKRQVFVEKTGSLQQMMDLGVLYNIAGVILIGSTIPMMSIKPQLSLIAGIFGILLLIYPALRARVSFDEACASAIKNLKALSLGWEEAQGTEQAPSQ